jgi:hypothetical protein
MFQGLKVWAIAMGVSLVLMGNALASIDAKSIIFNIEKNDKQAVRKGHIDSLIIKRGNAEFHLGPGELALYDFGSGRIAAMIYEGAGRFHYLPPDQVEAGQIRKFTGADTLDGQFKKAAFFFTVSLEGLPDSLSFALSTANVAGWGLLKEARNEEFDHIWINLTNKLIGDLVSAGEGTYFNAYFSLDGVGDLVFEEDPFNDDYYTLYEIIWHAGSETFDILSGYSPDDGLVSRRGVIPIDITNYDIDTRIEADGDMTARCRVTFTPVRPGRRFIYFIWHHQNEIISVLDSQGDTLLVTRRLDNSGLFTAKANEPGFGVILIKSPELGKSDYVDISFQSKCLMKEYGNFYIKGKTIWYPRSANLDLATFNLSFDSPELYDVVSCGDKVESKITGDNRRLSKWITPDAVEFVSFNIGDFYSKLIIKSGLPPVKAFVSRAIPHDSVALMLLQYYGLTSNADMAGRIGADIANSSAFYTSLFGPCPFDTIRATELYNLTTYDRDINLTKEGQGSPGLVHLSWGDYQFSLIEGLDTRLRAHETAHQWWGHTVATESYRDTWILEGLAEYSSFWYYEMAVKDKKACDRVLEYWHDWTLSGVGANSKGNKAGPVILGYRLSSSKSDDYNPIVYDKGAYIFHMIRYLLHDYKTASDDAFAAFLKDLAVKYKGNIITTPKLQKLLEDHTGQDMSWFFNQWVCSTDIPQYTFSSKVEEKSDGEYLVTCHIRQENVSPGFKMPVPVTILFAHDRYIHLPVWVDRPEQDIELPLLPYKPKKLIFNTYDAVLCKIKYR